MKTQDRYVEQLEEFIFNSNAPAPVKRQYADKLHAYITKKREENRKDAIESGRLSLYRQLKIPEGKIDIELSEYAIGSSAFSPFPFFLMKRTEGAVVNILFHNYPVAKKVIRSLYGKTEIDEHEVTALVINRWLDVEGYTWYHVEDFDVLPDP